MATTPVKPTTKVKVATPKAPEIAPAKTLPVATKKPVVKTAKPIVETAKKADKEKAPKLKMERDSFTMPKVEYAQIYLLKDKLMKLGQPAKKSELLRAGLMLLSAMDDEKLKATMAKIPAIKTGRPKK
jgi:hypothetical protein